MATGLAERVNARLQALQINPFEAARRAGLRREYVNELIAGKKSSIREVGLRKLAGALECDFEFLDGSQPTPRRGNGNGAGHSEVPLAGICEAGVWREPGPIEGSLAIPDFGRQHTPFLVRGDHAAGFGIPTGSVVLVDEGGATREGDHVVVRRSRPTGEVETTVRRLVGGALSASPPTNHPPIASISRNEAEIVGLIVVAFRTFA